MVNTSLQALFDAMRVDETNNIIPLSAKAPFFDYDSGSGLITLYTTTHYLDTKDADRLRLFWNTPTNTIFGGFDTTVALRATSLLFDDKLPIE